MKQSISKTSRQVPDGSVDIYSASSKDPRLLSEANNNNLTGSSPAKRSGLKAANQYTEESSLPGATSLSKGISPVKPNETTEDDSQVSERPKRAGTPGDGVPIGGL